MPIKLYPFILISLIFFYCGNFKQKKIELQKDKLDFILDSYVNSGVYPFLYARIEGESGVVYEHSVTNESLLGELKIGADTWMRIWSMSKLVTISIAMDLIEENKLSLSDPVTKYTFLPSIQVRKNVSNSLSIGNLLGVSVPSTSNT